LESFLVACFFGSLGVLGSLSIDLVFSLGFLGSLGTGGGLGLLYLVFVYALLMNKFDSCILYECLELVVYKDYSIIIFKESNGRENH
jgi:hypothetical protein